MHNFIGFVTPKQNSDPVLRKYLDRATEEWMDGWKEDRIYFIEPFQLPPRIQ